MFAFIIYEANVASAWEEGGGGVVVSPLSMSFTLTILCLSYAQTIGGWGEHTRTDKGGKGKATSGGFVLCSR